MEHQWVTGREGTGRFPEAFHGQYCAKCGRVRDVRSLYPNDPCVPISPQCQLTSENIKTLDVARELLDSERPDHETKAELLKRLYRVKGMIEEEIAVLEG